MSEFFVGIDLGGTKIYTALADKEGEIIEKIKTPTQANKGEDVVLDNIVDSVDRVLKDAGQEPTDVSALGLGSPGPTDTRNGILTEPPNLPFENIPLEEILEERLGIPVILDNDATAAALGEQLFGAGRGVENLIYITVSTGIGGGIVIDGDVYHGFNGGAGEVGHMVVEPKGRVCGCGNRGCLEAMASGTAIGRMGLEALRHGTSPLIEEMSGGDEEKIDALLVAQAARKGDKKAEEIYDTAGFYLGVGLGNLINLLNPQMVLFGGGVSKDFDIFSERMLSVARKNAMSSSFEAVEVKPAALGDEVGLMGAVALAVKSNL